MITSCKCPSCNETIQFNVENNKIVSVSIDPSIETSDEKIKLLMSQKGIELG